jgi:hypothetical protein
VELQADDMPRSGEVLPPAQVETSAGMRAMAQHARRLASTIQGDVAADRLLEFAGELEARADELEVVVVKRPERI